MRKIVTCAQCGQDVPADATYAGVVGGQVRDFYCRSCYEDLFEEGGQFTLTPEEANRVAIEHFETEGKGRDQRVKGCFGFVLPLLLALVLVAVMMARALL